MTSCQACDRPTQLYLCDDCTTNLNNMLDQIPWLIEELDARIQKLDRIQLGTIGSNRTADTMTVIDFDAAELARTTRKKLLNWVTQVAQKATGRTPPGLSTITTTDLARWLNANTHHIARQAHAGALYRDITQLVGTDDQRNGQLVRAINPIEKHLAGPCPTITGRNHDGTPRHCGETLFADTYDQTTTCPECGQDINVEDNRRRAAADRDLHTREQILETLANIDETTTTAQLDAWIKARRLQRKAWLHDATIVEYRLSETDEPVYSLDRARKLRRRDNTLKTRLQKA